MAEVFTGGAGGITRAVQGRVGGRGGPAKRVAEFGGCGEDGSFHDLEVLLVLRGGARGHLVERIEFVGEESIAHVTVENPSKSLAFFVRLKVSKGVDGEEILPVVWEDNYISLLPGEKREVSATYRTSEVGTAQATVEVSGWNVE